MARPLAFVCQSCGSAHPKWSGRCDDCGAWNTLAEEQAAPPAGVSARRIGKGRAFALEGLSTIGEEPARRLTRIAEFDRVAGGGLVPGSALLLGGDPGVGKSTLVLQLLAAYAGAKKTAVYISGEEALAQVRLRAARMGLANAPVQLGLGDLRRGYSGDGRHPNAARHPRHRFYSNGLDLRARSGARHNRASAHGDP